MRKRDKKKRLKWRKRWPSSNWKYTLGHKKKNYFRKSLLARKEKLKSKLSKGKRMHQLPKGVSTIKTWTRLNSWMNLDNGLMSKLNLKNLKIQRSWKGLEKAKRDLQTKMWTRLERILMLLGISCQEIN